MADAGTLLPMLEMAEVGECEEFAVGDWRKISTVGTGVTKEGSEWQRIGGIAHDW